MLRGGCSNVENFWNFPSLQKFDLSGTGMECEEAENYLMRSIICLSHEEAITYNYFWTVIVALVAYQREHLQQRQVPGFGLPGGLPCRRRMGAASHCCLVDIPGLLNDSSQSKIKWSTWLVIANAHSIPPQLVRRSIRKNVLNNSPLITLRFPFLRGRAPNEARMGAIAAVRNVGQWAREAFIS